jgi:hypothetical protein
MARSTDAGGVGAAEERRGASCCWQCLGTLLRTYFAGVESTRGAASEDGLVQYVN